MPDLTALHLLRPHWFWALLPIALIGLALVRQQSAAARWRGVIAPHLLEHLIVKPSGGWRLRPIHLLLVTLVVAAVAMAGPTWQREPPPFTEDTSPLVIAMDLSRSMLVNDIQPSRLERAKHKARDLLAERKGAKTALIVYAGSAHTVLPLTDDPSVLTSFVESLDPAIMPTSGKKPDAALGLAARLLEDETAPGSILFLTDGIASAAVPAFVKHGDGTRDQVIVLAVGTAAGGPLPEGGGISALDRAGLEALSAQTSSVVTPVTVDDSDVEEVLKSIETHLTAAQQEDQEGRWRDEGWWLLFPVAALMLMWFRRGWLVEWEA